MAEGDIDIDIVFVVVVEGAVDGVGEGGMPLPRCIKEQTPSRWLFRQAMGSQSTSMQREIPFVSTLRDPLTQAFHIPVSLKRHQALEVVRRMRRSKPDQ